MGSEAKKPQLRISAGKGAEASKRVPGEAESSSTEILGPGGREEERHRCERKRQNWLSPAGHWLGIKPALVMCPDQELNPPLFSVQDNASTNRTTLARAAIVNFNNIFPLKSSVQLHSQHISIWTVTLQEFTSQYMASGCCTGFHSSHCWGHSSDQDRPRFSPRPSDPSLVPET